MSWRALTSAAALVEGENADEAAKLVSAAGGSDAFPSILTSAILEARGVISATGGELDADTTALPDSIRPHVIAIARWRWLIAYPALRQLQTDERKLAADAAAKVLDDIAKGDRSVEGPTDSTNTGGNWNADTKLTLPTQSTRANT